MALMSYKCPNCGGGLVFDPDSQKFQCEYCLSEFTEEEMKRMEEVSAPPAEEGEAVLEEEGRLPRKGARPRLRKPGRRPFTPVPAAGPRSSLTPPQRLPSAITAITRWSFPAAFRETICRTLSSPLPLIKRRPRPAS